MTWFKVDDGFYDHPKVHELMESRHWKGALALWTLAGAWCAKHETDGFISAKTVKTLRGTRAECAELVRVGLWIPVENGFVFNDWAHRNPTKQELEERRAKTRQRVENWRQRRVADKAEGSLGNAVTNESVTRIATQAVTLPPTRPDPTRPDPLTTFGGERACARPPELSGGHIQAVRDTLAAEALTAGLKVAPSLPHTQLRQVAERVQAYAKSAGKPFAEACTELVRSGLQLANVSGQRVGFALLECEPGKTYEPKAPVGSVRRTLSVVREERKRALLGGDLEAVARLNVEVDELERAEEARARGGYRARA